MCRWMWDSGFWGYPFFFGWGGIAGILFQLAVLGLIMWAVTSVVRSFTSPKQQNIKDGGAR